MTTNIKPFIILDKSYLKSASKQKMSDLENRYHILMIDSLLFEIVRQNNRAAYFSKFGAREKPYELTPSLAVAFQYEAREQKAYGKPSAHVRNVDYANHLLLTDRNYVLNEELEKATSKRGVENKLDGKNLVCEAFAHESYYQEKLGKRGGPKKQAEIELEIMSDFFRTKRIVRGLGVNCCKNTSNKDLSIELIGSDWYSCRYVQAMDLFCLDLIMRHKISHLFQKYEETQIASQRAGIDCKRVCEIIDVANSISYSESTIAISEEMAAIKNLIQKAEHDAEDMAYLLFGVSEGSFATQEKKLARWFQLFNPAGILEKLT